MQDELACAASNHLSMPASKYILDLRRRIGHELLQIPSVSVLIFDPGDRVLLARHHQGNRWSTTGGMIEPGETPADAAVREAWEETGTHVELLSLIGVFGGPTHAQTFSNGDSISWVTSAFRARIIDGELRPDGEEILELGWFTQSEAAALNLKPHARMTVDAAFSSNSSAYFQRPTWKPPGRRP